MRTCQYIGILAAAMLSCACMMRETHGFETIDYVKKVVADTTGGELGLIKALGPGSPRGGIAIIGEPEECIFLAECFLKTDEVDNITGNPRKDRLPDFAGETVCAYLDEAHAPYAAFTGGREITLREVTVRNVIASVDTLCRLNSFNVEATQAKLPAKLIVLSSSLCAACGYADVDTLFKMASRPMTVVTPVGALLDDAFSEASGTLNVGVWADEKVIASEAYQAAFRRKAALSGGISSTISAICPSGEGDAGNRFLRWLDSYSQTGSGFPLNVLLLDDYGTDVKVLNEKLSEIRRMETPAMMEYNRLLAPDFHFLEASSSVTGNVYRLMRKNHLFTHDIAYPKLQAYQSVATEDGSFVMIPSGEQTVTRQTRGFIEENTALAREYYAVQAKH